MWNSNRALLTGFSYPVGVSYVSIFIVAYHLVFWLGGAAHSISWDYLPGVPQGEAAQRHVSWKEKPIGRLVARHILHQDVPDSFAVPVAASKPKDEESLSGSETHTHTVDEKSSSVPVAIQEVSITRQNSPVSTLAASTHLHSALSTSVTPAASSAVNPATSATVTPAHSTPDLTKAVAQSEPEPPKTGLQKVLKVLRPLKHIVTPITITLAIALPIALIQPLKALFVDVSDQGGPSFKAPDGRPPLSFMIDTGAYPLPRPVYTSSPA